ncbi:Protein of unknown function [Streptococcus thermophilus]|nr:Protein of unknown function [Streptococcus thermophilus]
MAKRKQR